MKPTRITLVPHTHWDREWYQTFEEFLDRLVVMMDLLIEVLDDGFPHFHLDGQTAMIDDYLAVRPERREDIERLAREGKLSVGPWFTQMDEFLTSGESHVRNLERGMARARELGTPLRVGYLPDQFGHIGQMPQILRLGGIERAVVWRGVPSDVDRTQFWWESPDGSRVLTEYLAFGYALGGGLEGARRPREMAELLGRIAELLADYSPGERALVMVGADHTGPDRTLPHRLDAARKRSEQPEAVVGSLAEHLVGDAPAGLPVWRGELRSSARAHLLPNVYSARVHQKRERGRLETLVERYAEPLAALVPGFEWPAAELDRIWQLLLWNGAHDSVCGCSVDGVAKAVDERHAEARGIAERIVDAALSSLAGQVTGTGLLRFNPSPFERGGVPGLGWRLHPTRGEPDEETVRVEAVDGWIQAEGVAFRLLDEPDVGDLYNFSWRQGKERTRARGPDRLELQGPVVRAEFEGLDVELHVSRPGGEGPLRLRGAIDNRRENHRLRLHVRLAREAGGSVAGSPFELIDRPLVSEGGEHEAASPAWPARGVVMAGEVAVLAEGVIEYEIVDGRELAITLLRCVGTISRARLATRPWGAGPDIPTPEAQMIGRTALALAVMPDARRGALLPAWERFALPMRAAVSPGGGPLPGIGTLLEVNGAELSAARRVQGAIEVRVWNPAAEPTEARVGDRRVPLRPGQIATVRP